MLSWITRVQLELFLRRRLTASECAEWLKRLQSPKPVCDTDRTE